MVALSGDRSRPSTNFEDFASNWLGQSLSSGRPQSTAPVQPAASPPNPTRRATPTPAPNRRLTPELQKAYDRAQQRFGHIPGAQIEVVASPGNGGKPVVMLRHRDGKKEGYDAQMHFHGDQLFDQRVGYDKEIGKAVERAWQKSKDTVFILPEANNENKAPRSDWNNATNLDRTMQDGLRGLGLDPSAAGSRTVSGHSAGGSVIAKALARGELRGADRIELYDAAVGSTHNHVSGPERARVAAYARSHPNQFVVMPGIMTSSAWNNYVDRSRFLPRASDHWAPLWNSLGQFREP